MWPSRHPEQVETAPAVTTTDSQLCDVETGCLSREGGQGALYSEMFSEETEVFIEDVVDAAGSWLSTRGAIAEVIQGMREDIEREHADLGVVQERSQRRSQGNRVEQALSAKIALAHNNARTRLRPVGQEDFGRRLVKAESPQDIVDIMMHLNGMLHENSDYGTRLEQAFYLLFVGEDLARANLAYLDQRDPSAMRQIFDPANFEELPSGLKQIVALDIANGKEGSVMLRNATRELDSERTPAEQLAHYLHNNHLSDNIRNIVVGISIGAKALGSPACPLNNSGLCTRLLEKIQIDELPDSLRRDMELRSSKATQELVGKLTQRARQVNVPRVLNSAVAFDTHVANIGTGSQSSKRKRNAVPIERRDVSLVESNEDARRSFDRVEVRILNEETVIGFDFNEGWGAEEGIAALFETEFMTEYVNKHQEAGGLSESLAQAMRHILFSTSYAQTNGAIAPIVMVGDRYEKSVEGVKERYQCFRGQKAQGAGIGKIGRETRIVFSRGSNGKTRYITLHKIGHKSEFVKNGRILWR